MTEREMLLRAVCENPDDDTPRLVFADWLDENGEPERAEFIRVQIEVARLPKTDRRRGGRLRRIGEIETQCGTGWLKELPVPKPGHVDWVRYTAGWLEGEVFDRGFAARLWCKTATTFATHADTLLAASPVRRLLIHHLMKADKLVRVTRLRHLHTLRIRILSQRAALELVECPHLDPVPDIRLPLASLPTEHVEHLRQRFGDRLRHQP